MLGSSWVDHALNNNPVLVQHPIAVPNVRYFHSMSSLEPWVLINIDDFSLDKCTCMGINSCPHILSSTLTSKIGLYGIGRWTGISCIAMAACSPLSLTAVPQIDQLELAFLGGVGSLSSLFDICFLAWTSSCKMQVAISVIMHAVFIISGYCQHLSVHSLFLSLWWSCHCRRPLPYAGHRS